MQINILVNGHRIDAITAAKQAVGYLRERDVRVGSDIEGSELIGVESVRADELANANLVITFGGDGTLIRAAHICSTLGTPILGVYYGRFGFVTQCNPADIGAALSLFFDGQARIEERMMLQAELIRNEQVVATLHSLNEAVLQRAATTRMLHFEVTVDGHMLTRYPADGVMVATPTGSTAYNLSAGGPICHPQLSAMLVTAITPHTLSARPLVLSADSVIDVRIETRGDAILSSDGQSRLQMLSGDSVRIRRSDRVTKLVTVDEGDFLVKLTEKLLWSHHVPEGGPSDED